MGGGENLNQSSLSASISLRQRIAVIKESEKEIKIDLAISIPSQLHVVLHWDDKVIKDANRTESDERFSIVMSSQNLDRRTKFLSAPHIPDGTYASMLDVLMAIMQIWNIPSENMIGMCWDTTASNTGTSRGFSIFVRTGVGMLPSPHWGAAHQTRRC